MSRKKTWVEKELIRERANAKKSQIPDFQERGVDQEILDRLAAIGNINALSVDEVRLALLQANIVKLDPDSEHYRVVTRRNELRRMTRND